MSARLIFCICGTTSTPMVYDAKPGAAFMLHNVPDKLDVIKGCFGGSTWLALTPSRYDYRDLLARCEFNKKKTGDLKGYETRPKYDYNVSYHASPLYWRRLQPLATLQILRRAQRYEAALISTEHLPLSMPDSLVLLHFRRSDPLTKLPTTQANRDIIGARRGPVSISIARSSAITYIPYVTD